MKRSVALATSLVTALSAADAFACAACGAGDPTLTALGTEQPYAGRFRAALDLRHRQDRVGTPGRSETELDEYRLDASLAYAPTRRLFISALQPMVRRDVRYTRESRKRTIGLGDAELRAKVFVFRDRDYGARHLVAVTGGVKAPTGERQDDPATGRPLPMEVQSGTGTWDGLVGASYALSSYPWATYLAVNALLPGAGENDSRGSRSLRLTTAVQRHVLPSVALRGGLDGRIDGRAREWGRTSHDSGGFIAFATAEALVAPGGELTFFSAVRWPVYSALHGHHTESPVLSMGVARDF